MRYEQISRHTVSSQLYSIVFANTIYCIQNNRTQYMSSALTKQMITFCCFAEEWKCDDINAEFSINLTRTVKTYIHNHNVLTPGDRPLCALLPCALFLPFITLFIILYTRGRIFHLSLSFFPLGRVWPMFCFFQHLRTQSLR